MKGNLWMEIRSEKKKGLSYTEIGRKHHIDPRTAKKYAESETTPQYTARQKKPSKLDPYKDYIDGACTGEDYLWDVMEEECCYEDYEEETK